MKQLTSRSIFWLAIVLFVESVLRVVIDDGGVIDVLALILIWIANSIVSGSTTACRWAVFLMGLYAIGRWTDVYEFVSDSSGRSHESIPLAVDVSLSVVISLWSSLNLFLAERVLRQANQMFFSPFVRNLAIGVAVLAVISVVVRYVATPSYAHPEEIEEHYAQQVAFLRKFAATDQGIHESADEVQAVFANHPEILEAEVQTGENSYQSILGFRVQEKSTWFNRFGTAVDEKDGTEIPIVVYTGWTRNARGERREIRMIVRDIWQDGGH